jgi:hypothetical protein
MAGRKDRKDKKTSGRNRIVVVVVTMLFGITAFIAFSRFADIHDLVAPVRVDSAYVRLHDGGADILEDSIHDDPSDLGMDYENFSVTTSDGLSLGCWYIPSEQSGAINLLMVHDLGRSRISLLEEAFQFHQRGFGICLPDMRAHGISDGSHATLGYLEAYDIRAVADTLFGAKGISELAIMGYGTGACAAIRAVRSDVRIKSLVAENVFDNLSNFVREYAGQKWGSFGGMFFPMMRRNLENELHISIDSVCPLRDVKTFSIPSFFVSSTGSERFHVRSARQVYDSCAWPLKKLWVIDAKQPSDAGEEYYNKIALFIVKSPSRKYIKSRFRRLASHDQQGNHRQDF